MATLLRGKNKGKKVKIMQWCNDWFSIELNGFPKIVSPLAIKLTSEETTSVFIHQNNGSLLKEFDLHPDTGIFKRR